MEPTAEQAAAIAHRGGNAYIGAGPGTGKTYLLIERLRELLRRGASPDRMIVLTFSRRAASELRARIRDANVSDEAVDVRTFHGFAARVAGGGLARFRDMRLLDDFSRRLVLEVAIARTPTATIHEASRTSEALVDECRSLIDDLARVDDAARRAIGVRASLRLADVLAIRDRFAAEQRALGGGDLGDLVSRAVAETGRPGSAAQTWLAGRYDHVLVDEFQDTDREQLLLLERCGAEIFAVGDEAQSIYRFRGASDAIVPYAVERLAMRRYALSVSRRCPPAVCAFASETPLPELAALRSAKTDRDAVEIGRYATVDAEAFAIADAIEHEIGAGRAQIEIAVLLRSYRPLGPLIAAELARRNVDVATAGPEALIGDPQVATLRAALLLFASPGDRTRWADLLASPALQLDPLAVRIATAGASPLRIDESLAAALSNLKPPTARHAHELAEGLIAAYAAWTAGDVGLAARRIVRRFGLVAAVLRDSPPASVRVFGARLKRVCDVLAAAQRTARALAVPSSPRDIVERIDDILSGVGADATIDAAGVRVLTVHAAKGLEFERVFIADAVQGRFPREPRASSLLSEADRALLSAHGVDGASVAPEGAIREELSLWFVAITRCSDRLTVTFADRDTSGSPQRPSRFLRSRSHVAVTNVPLDSLVVRALEAADPLLREALLASSVVRDVPVLDAFARNGAQAFAPCAGPALERQRAFGVRDATDWLRCPRSVFYGRFLNLPQDGTAAADIGTLIHRVLQRFHETHESFDGVGDRTEAWIAELLALRVALWDAAVFETEPIAAAAARSVDVALRAYAIGLHAYAAATPFTVESRELKVAIPVGAFSIAGRIDRVDRLADGSRVIVDYKRGAAKPSPIAEAVKIEASWAASADAADAGETPRILIGNMPKDLDLQLAFYATALENVRSLAKIYLGGAADMEKRAGVAAIDTVTFAGPLETVARGALAELERDALAPLAGGGMAVVPVAIDEKTCEYCAFQTICPGPIV